MINDNYFEDASKGIFILDDREYVGELILETYGTCNRSRIYKFINEENKIMYMRAFLDTKSIICPECKESVYSFHFGKLINFYEQEHKKKCKYDRGKIHALYEKENEKCDKWGWMPEGEPLLESILLHLFNFSKFCRRDEFKKFSKLIHKENERLRE